MLVQAALYKKELTSAFQSKFYSEDMFLTTASRCNWCPNIDEDGCSGEGNFQYAIVNDKGKLIGYFGYIVDWYCSKAYNFGLMSFDKGNVRVGQDVFNEMSKLLDNLHRIEWRAVSGNPACDAYDRFIAKHGGAKHVLKDAIRDQKGMYHDDIIYEIVKGANCR